MADIQVAVEDSVAATEALLQIHGISGNYTKSGETQREGTAATIATIVGIVGGTMAIAEQIRKWYLEYKQHKSGKKNANILSIYARIIYIITRELYKPSLYSLLPIPSPKEMFNL